MGFEKEQNDLCKNKINSENKQNDLNLNYQKNLEKILDFFDIPKKDICIIGSAALKYFGLRENRDIDFLATPEIRQQLHNKINSSKKLKHKYNLKSEGRIGFGNGISLSAKNRLGFMNLSDKDIIHNKRFHYEVDGFKILRLELVIAKKHALGRPKDKQDIRLVEKSGFIGGPEWDWELFRPLPPWERPKKALWKRGLKSIFHKGIYTTLTKIIGRYSEKGYSVLKGLDQLSKSTPLAKIQCDVEIRICPAKILNAHYAKGRFDGWDIIVEYDLSNDNLLKINDIKSFRKEKKLAKDLEPVTINGKKQLVRGKTSFVNFLKNPNSMIEVEIASNSRKERANDKWLEKIGLNNYQKNILKTLKTDIFEQNGAFFYAFLWPPASHIFSEIENHLKDSFNIIETMEYSVDQNFEDFFRELYAFDNSTKEWLIEKKLRLVTAAEQPKFKILILEVFNSSLINNGSLAEKRIVEKITRIKNECRQRFQSKMNPYVFDNMLHITDNYRQNKVVYQLLKQYYSTSGKNLSRSPDEEI